MCPQTLKQRSFEKTNYTLTLTKLKLNGSNLDQTFKLKGKHQVMQLAHGMQVSSSLVCSI